MMFRAYKYRLYPTLDQQKLIGQTFSVCRFVYNLALETKIYAYKSHGKKLSSFDLCYQLIDLKKDFPWVSEVDSQALQASVKRVDVAFKNFFRGNGFPKFKSKTGRQSFQCPNNARKIDFENNLLTVPKIKNIPILISRKFEGKIKMVTISRTPTGKYFASILVGTDKSIPSKKAITEATSIGIDMGIKDFAVLSNGEKIANPKHLASSLKRLKVLQKRASRKKKGSKNRKKENRRVAIIHERITNQRNDFSHKVSSAITKQYGTICVEDLAIKNMVKNHKLSQAISDAGWGEFFRQLQYKSDWNGNNFLKAPRFFASTKTCSNCNIKNDTLTLADREWICVNCNALHDRDENAATNMKQYCLTNSGEGISEGPVESLAIAGAAKQEYLLVE